MFLKVSDLLAVTAVAALLLGFSSKDSVRSIGRESSLDRRREGSLPLFVNKTSQFFTRVWTPRDGLGPLFNARSCAACHATPTAGGSGGADPRALVVLFGSTTDATGGHVFLRLRVDGRGAVTDRQPPDDSILRMTPPLFGLGLLEQVPEATIRAEADAENRNLDGIRGRTGSGRFGWKARFVSLDQAVAAAFANELGLGTREYPDSSEHPGGTGVEITDAQLRSTVAFVRRLPPLDPEPLDRGVEAAGLRTFTRIGCGSCHRSSFNLPTGSMSAYTDLLLHDMGPGLADGVAEGAASGQDFRTAPLWGLGRTGPPYLHDGRAKSIDAAILEHGGEATASANAYRALSPADRTVLLAFLKSR